MMKNLFLCTAIVSVAVLYGCEKATQSVFGEDGKLTINLELDQNVTHITRSGSPDVADFVLEILDGDLVVKELAPVGTANPEINLAEGDYKVRIYSASFSEPVFGIPVYGAEQAISIISGQESTADLTCKQTNAGVRIVYDAEFQAAYTTYSTSVSQGGKTQEYTGTYTDGAGYFLPGDVVITVTADGRTEELELTLFPCRLYSIVVKDGPASGDALKISIGLNTDVEEEDVDFFFPKEVGGGDPPPAGPQIVYQEGFGSLFQGDTEAGNYTGWDTQGPSWSGQAVISKPGAESAGYTFASGENALVFASISKTAEVNGLDISQYDVKLDISFAVSASGSAPVPDDLVLSVDHNGQGMFIGRDYTLTDAGSGWWVAQVTWQVPKTATSLSLKFVSARVMGTVYLDDIRVTVAE